MIIYFISFFRVYLHYFVNTRMLLLILHVYKFSLSFYLRYFLKVEFYLFHFLFQCFFFSYLFFFFLLHFNVSTFISKHVFFSFIFHSPPPLSRIVVVIIPFHFMPDFCYSLHETRKRIPCMSIHPPLSFLPSPYFVL